MENSEPDGVGEVEEVEVWVISFRLNDRALVVVVVVVKVVVTVVWV